MSVVAGVRRELERLPEDLRESGIAAVALAMAERIDSGKGSPSECGKVVVDALTRLREMAPPEQQKTRVDELRERRAKRLEGGSAAAH